MAETKAAYAVEDSGKRTLDDVIDGADIFLGCSGPKVLTQEMVKKMARAPMILALANPGAGDSAAAGERGTLRRHYLYRPLRLSEPGEQRAVLPVHLPRRAGRRCNGD